VTALDMPVDLRKLSPARIEARDRRMAAIHEAGHAVIARHVGARSAQAHIERHSAADPFEKTWTGQCRVAWIEHKVSPAHDAMISVAGAVAEHVWDGDGDFLRAEGEWAWHEEAIMSPTDWDMAGCAPGKPDAAFMRAVDKVIDLLTGPLKPELYATARRLIADA
jgi:hypothetical protein